MVYRFIDNNKEYFGLRWLCHHFGISVNCYYNYLKDNKCNYHKQREVIYEKIKYGALTLLIFVNQVVNLDIIAQL